MLRPRTSTTAEQAESLGAGAAAEGASLPKVGDLVLGGKYRMQAVLGAGGMGVVMAAEHVALGQNVAFKFLTPRAADADATARFVREARAAARLDSEHVVRVSDVGVLESGPAYILMERLEGEDLAHHLQRAGPLPVEAAVLYLVQACDAVAAAHAAGVVHRDLKPSNLFLVRRRDGSPSVKVLDFGISKAFGLGAHELERSLTRPGIVLGSPLYMSPEQVRGSKGIDERTDIWSLGMVLYELLVGSPMYDFDTFPALCAAIAADPSRPLRAGRPDAPPGLEAAVLRCTQKAPANRFPSVAEFASAIAPYGPPEGVLLAARVARRLGSGGESPRPSERPFVHGAGPNDRQQITAPPATRTSPDAPAPRRARVALWLVGAVAVLASTAAAATFIARARYGNGGADRGEPSRAIEAPRHPTDSAAPAPPSPDAPPRAAAGSSSAATAAPPASAPNAARHAPDKKPPPAPPRPAKRPSEFDDEALINRR